MLALIRSARRRLFNNELLAQGANTISAALLAFIVLLLLGTQVLDWRFTLVVTAGAGIYCILRARKLRPSNYAAARTVDHRLQLADTLSTAVYFREDAHRDASTPEVRDLQWKRAEEVAGRVDLKAALPYRMPRTAYAAMALLLVAASLFVLRYGLTRRLDLHEPLVSMLPFQFGSRNADVARNMKRPPAPRTDPQDNNGAAAADPDQIPTDEPDPTVQEDSESNGNPEQKGGASKSQTKGAQKGEQSGESEQEAQAEQNSEAQSGEQNGKQGNKQDSKESNNGKDSANGNEGSSLMSKMKDAIQNLLSSVKPPNSQPGNQQQDPQNSQQQGKQNNGKQQGSKNSQQQNASQSDSQDGQQGEQAQSPQDPQGKGEGKSDSKQANKQPGSGIGNQDGDKAIKQAEALAAMGKISEIFGKRSKDITGEATVEVQSTSQQLHTAYAQKSAEHVQNGAEITRDEVPVAMQPFVQQYFEQVRKQAPAPQPPAKK